MNQRERIEEIQKGLQENKAFNLFEDCKWLISQLDERQATIERLEEENKELRSYKHIPDAAAQVAIEILKEDFRVMRELAICQIKVAIRTGLIKDKSMTPEKAIDQEFSKRRQPGEKKTTGEGK